MANLSPEAAANIRYQKAHLDDSRVPEIVASLVICLPLALTAVALRFLARRKGKIAIKADDWWIAIGLVSPFLAAMLGVQRKADGCSLGIAFHNGLHSMRNICHALGPRSPCRALEISCEVCKGLWCSV